MSNRIRISRRAVMQMGLLSPLVAMKAAGANEQDITMNALLLADIPDESLTDIIGRGSQRCQAKGYCPDHKPDDLKTVAATLWMYFGAGVRQGEAKMPQAKADKIALLKAAYEVKNANTLDEQSGDLIVDCLPLWNAWGHEPVTNYCAFRCGINAAAEAKRLNPGKPNPVVTAAMYPEAFKQTQAEMKPVLDKARCLHHPGGPGGPASSRGAGC